MRYWFENPHSPEFLQTSAKMESPPPALRRATDAAKLIGETIQMAAPLLIEACALGALAYGCCLAWRPLGFIVPGGVLLSLSIAADVRKSDRKKATR